MFERDEHDDVFETLTYDKMGNTTKAGRRLSIDNKTYFIPEEYLGEHNPDDKTIEVKKWYYDRYFI